MRQLKYTKLSLEGSEATAKLIYSELLVIDGRLIAFITCPNTSDKDYTRATIDSIDDIERLGLHTTDIVVLDTTTTPYPKIVKVVLEKRQQSTKPLQMPLPNCLSCDTQILRLEDDSHFFCKCTKKQELRHVG
jgi:NAD-dependent DNA ligase